MDTPRGRGAADSRIRTIVAGFGGSVVGEAVLGPAVWLHATADKKAGRTSALPEHEKARQYTLSTLERVSLGPAPSWITLIFSPILDSRYWARRNAKYK